MSLSITDLLRKKLLLEKFRRLPNLDELTMTYVNKIWNDYCDWLHSNKGVDVDYPNLNLEFK